MPQELNLNARQQEILQALDVADFLTIESLAARFDVSTQTIRRDVNDLRDLQLLQRIHKGVRRADPIAPYATRATHHVQAKARIARAVADLIPEGSSVSIGIGTTPAELARILAQGGRYEIATNNLVAATYLWDSDAVELSVCGGIVRDRSVTGDSAVRFFEEFKVDFAVYGVAGVDTDGGLLDFRREEVRTREAMRRGARQSILVLDGTKFGRRASARGGWLGEADIIATDCAIPEPLRDQVRDTTVLIVPHPANDGQAPLVLTDLGRAAQPDGSPEGS